MKRKIDELGRLVIPKEMRKELGIKDNDQINIECIGNKVIITKPDAVDYKARVEKAIYYIFQHELVDGGYTLDGNILLEILNGKKD